MKNVIVFLDLDGVIVDFLAGVHRLFNKPYEPEKIIEWNLFSVLDIPLEELFKKATEDWWASLDWAPGGREIFKYVKDEVGEANLYFLTTTLGPFDTSSPNGKARWISNNIGKTWPNKLIIIYPKVKKALLARGPNCILIDDNQENCLEFSLAGGNYVLVPAPYNCKGHASKEVKILSVKEQLQNIQTQCTNMNNML